MAAAGILMASGLLLFIPWRAADKYFHYRGMRPDLRRLASDRAFGDAIVLVRGRRFPDYASATVYNPIDPNSHQQLFAWDRGPEIRRELVHAFTGRPFWIVNGPSLGRDGYAVVAGPLTGTELLARPDSLAPAP